MCNIKRLIILEVRRCEFAPCLCCPLIVRLGAHHTYSACLGGELLPLDVVVEIKL